MPSVIYTKGTRLLKLLLLLLHPKLLHRSNINRFKLEIVDQRSTRIPPPSGSGYQWAMHGLQLNILQNHQASIYPYTRVMCYWSLDLKFKAKLKLEPGNRKIQYGRQRPFWKWHCWKSIGSFPYTQVMWRWSLDLIFKAKLKLESGNQKIQDDRQAAILKVTSMKIYRPLPMATNNMHIKFEIEIPKQTWVMLRKSYRLQTDGRTDRQTDRRTKVNPV